jgi:hypothetical protein
MSLIQKKTTPRLQAANRANSLKSTGPQTKLGKAHSSRNAIKYGVFARLPVASMKELGEDPAAFEQLSESLRQALCPQDGFEQMLVEDMAEIRWRRQRLMRAEAGILASKRREFEIEREWKVANYGKGLAGVGNDILSHNMGLAALRPSDEILNQITECLEVIEHLVETEGFREEDSWMLKAVYGEKPSYMGRRLTGMFDRAREGAKDESGKDSGDVETTRRIFLETLGNEITSFRKLAELHHAKDVEVTEPLMDSQLIPSQEDLSKIMDYEAALEKQFERKLQQLVAWRRAKGEVDTNRGVVNK